MAPISSSVGSTATPPDKPSNRFPAIRHSQVVSANGVLARLWSGSQLTRHGLDGSRVRRSTWSTTESGRHGSHTSAFRLRNLSG